MISQKMAHAQKCKKDKMDAAIRSGERFIPQCLGICLFYQDEDIAADAIEYLLQNNHRVIVFDHGSTDGTMGVVESYREHLEDIIEIKRQRVPFNKVFAHVSRYVLENLIDEFDWVSFPESDEFLEGPNRSKSYYEHVVDVCNSPYNWLKFENMVYWFTEKDDKSIVSPVERIRYYAHRPLCGQRVYAWKMHAMNYRHWNHNDGNGLCYPVNFKTRHYQMRSLEHLKKRVFERCHTGGDAINHHFELMRRKASDMIVRSSDLKYDDGVSELLLGMYFDWSRVYGDASDLSAAKMSGRQDSEKDIDNAWENLNAVRMSDSQDLSTAL